MLLPEIVSARLRGSISSAMGDPAEIIKIGGLSIVLLPCLQPCLHPADCDHVLPFLPCVEDINMPAISQPKRPPLTGRVRQQCLLTSLQGRSHSIANTPWIHHTRLPNRDSYCPKIDLCRREKGSAQRYWAFGVIHLGTGGRPAVPKPPHQW